MPVPCACTRSTPAVYGATGSGTSAGTVAYRDALSADTSGIPCRHFGHTVEDCVLTYEDRLRQGTFQGEEPSTERLMDISEVVEPTGDISSPVHYEEKLTPAREAEARLQEPATQGVNTSPCDDGVLGIFHDEGSIRGLSTSYSQHDARQEL
ncbi:hypothetical protein ISCGN_012596 [Ixodes scapularis]